MRETEARDCAEILANAYGLGQRRVTWYADMIQRFDAGATATFLEGWVEREKAPPTIAAIKAGVQQRLQSMGVASATFEPRGDRMEALVSFRSVLEDLSVGPRDRADAFHRIRWMNPPCTQDEWRQARSIADARHHERNQKLISEGKEPRPARPPMRYPEPPAPAEPQTILSRQAHKAGFAALYEGMRQKLPSAHMVPFVLDAVRKAESDAQWEGF